MNEETDENMSKYYQGEKRLQGCWQHRIKKYFYQNAMPDYLNEFDHEEKTKIFNDVYSCIYKFYQLLDDIHMPIR